MSESSFKRRLRSGAVSAVVTAAASLGLAGPAHAGLAAFYNELVNTIQQAVVNQAMAAMGLGIEGAVAQSSAATQAEIAKGAMANKNVLEGLEAYRTEQDLRKKAVQMAEDLRQPATTCSTVAAQAGIGTAQQTVQAQLFRDQTRTLSRIRGNTNTAATLERSFAESGASFCSDAEAALGVCRKNNALGTLAGADQNAAYLFGGSDGSSTYSGGPGGAQTKAAESYIARVTAGLPPEQLRSVDYKKSPQSRAYIELMRRYTAVASMAAYSLNQIKAVRTPQANLGINSSMSDAPGFPQGKKDMSMLEAVQRFVATKFSPKSIEDAAKAQSPNQILRDMAQMGSFQLWIDHQTLLQDSRTEALMAHQLSLMTEQTLRPQLEAQRAAAARAVAAR